MSRDVTVLKAQSESLCTTGAACTNSVTLAVPGYNTFPGTTLGFGTAAILLEFSISATLFESGSSAILTGVRSQQILRCESRRDVESLGNEPGLLDGARLIKFFFRNFFFHHEHEVDSSVGHILLLLDVVGLASATQE